MDKGYERQKENKMAMYYTNFTPPWVPNYSYPKILMAA